MLLSSGLFFIGKDENLRTFYQTNLKIQKKMFKKMQVLLGKQNIFLGWNMKCFYPLHNGVNIYFKAIKEHKVCILKFSWPVWIHTHVHIVINLQHLWGVGSFVFTYIKNMIFRKKSLVYKYKSKHPNVTQSLKENSVFF